jgi:bifunctional enzyme CysN/CysC
MADAGTVVLVAIVSPLRADRAVARAMHEAAGLDFIEVFVNTPLEECERRDPKGLYRDARKGIVTGMTGVDAPYEPPEDADVVLVPHASGVDAGMREVLAALDALDAADRATAG